MALFIDDDGTITLFQGDSGEIVVSGLNPEKSCDVYFAIQTQKRVPVGAELMVKSNFSDTVTFVLTADYTDLLTVSKNKEYEIYQYGIKICSDKNEDTVFIANGDYGAVNQLIVYPKKVEGV